MEINNLPFFKYNPKVYESNVVSHNKSICECCGREVGVYIKKMYAKESIDCICMDCVASGDAANKYKGIFVQDADFIDNDEAKDELFHRTPGYISWQGENWAACCNDYCEYLGTVGTKELEELGIADRFFAKDGSFNGIEDVRDKLDKDGNMCGYLFRCLHCRQYYLKVDFA